MQQENLAKKAEELKQKQLAEDNTTDDNEEKQTEDTEEKKENDNGIRMKDHFDTRVDNIEARDDQRYIIEYDADEIYTPEAADAMRKTLSETFDNDVFLKASIAVEGGTTTLEQLTFAQLRPVLLDLFPLCELHDLTDKQLKAYLNGIQSLGGRIYGVDRFNWYSLDKSKTESDITNVVKLLQSLLVPDKETKQYQPSTEVLTI